MDTGQFQISRLATDEWIVTDPTFGPTAVVTTVEELKAVMDEIESMNAREYDEKYLGLGVYRD